jgi:hypothetical protein
LLAFEFDPTPSGDVCSLMDGEGYTTSYANLTFSVEIEEPAHFKTFPTGNWYNIGIQYYDEYGRTNGVILDEDISRAYIPTIPERSTVSAASLTDAGAVQLRINISTLPPSWAKFWKIVYSRAHTTSTMLQTVAINAAIYDTNFKRLDISGISSWNDDAGAAEAYIWEKGDRVRILSYDQGGTVQTDWAERLYEAEIVRENANFTGSDGHQSIDFFDVGLSAAQLTGSVIQIIRPSKEFGTDDAIYTEVDVDGRVWYDSANGEYVHVAGTTFQPYDGTIDVDIDGDAYMFRRDDYPIEAAGTGDLMVESYSVSDFRESVQSDKGRPTAVINREETEAPSTIVYTELLVPNTEINNLNRVYPDENFEEYDRNFGAINMLYNELNHLIMIQEDKVSKVMLGQNVMYDAQGQANYLGSVDTVLSQAIPVPGEYGIHEPHSFTSFAGTKYWIDLKRGVALRMGNKGIEEISRIGMSGWFQKVCDDTLDGADKTVVGIFDPLNEEYIVSFHSEDKHIVFNKGREGWTTRLSYKIVKGAYLNSYAYFCYDFYIGGFRFNRLFKFASSSTKYNMNGTESLTSPFVQFISNAEPNTLKNYLAIMIDANNEWDMIIDTENLS